VYFAWKTEDVPEDFRDSGAVMYACFAQLQSWAIGVPMLIVLGTSSTDATYFGRVFLIEIFAVSSVVVVVGPKVIKAFRIRRNPELGRKKGRVNVSGIYQPPVTNSINTAAAASFRLSKGSSQTKFDSGNQSFNTRSHLPNMQPLVHVESETIDEGKQEDEEMAPLSPSRKSRAFTPSP